MKQNFLLLAIIFCFFQSKSQILANVNFRLHGDTIKVRHYKNIIDKLKKDISTVVVPVFFNDEEIKNKNLLDSVKDGLVQVISIDYVFTQYKDKTTQDNLNKKRIMELYLHAPNILSQSMTKWHFIEQLGFTKDEDAKNLFHGFVIKYKKIIPYIAVNMAMVKADILSRISKPKDSLIRNIFRRNPDLSKELIVADFTCSMSPYYLEVMAWFCMQDFKTEVPFAFFNDGDGKPNEQKVIGYTGGIHQFKTNKLDTIVKYIFETTKTGCSGDQPENDIEAILKGLESNPSVKEVILIADNWSDMRDYNLRGLITKPVHVILCGTDNGINPQYLNLAKETKGSVHTMTQDLANLYKLKEGARFSMSGSEFIIRSNKIERLVF